MLWVHRLSHNYNLIFTAKLELIEKLESKHVSDIFCDVELIVERDNAKYQVTINNLLFANDNSGIVVPEYK